MAVEISEDQYKEALRILEDKGTKKAACEALGIAYNTKRLDKLLEEYQRSAEAHRRIRAEKRKQAMTNAELSEIIEDYLKGASFEELATWHHRSVASIQYYLKKAGALLRTKGKNDPLNPDLMPDECIRLEPFEVGQLVWSAKYNSIAEIRGIYKDAYRISVANSRVQEQAYQPDYLLGDLTHLEKIGVNLKSIDSYMRADEVRQTLYKTMSTANARKK